MTPEMPSFLTQDLANWISGILTIAIMSLLYKENPIYRVAEHLYIGTSAAHTIIATWHNTLRPAFTNSMMQEGQWWQLLPVAVGLLIYFNLYRPMAWVARIPMSFWIGYNAGMSFSVRIVVPMFNEITSAMKPLVAMSNGSLNLWGSISNIIFVASILGIVIYFFFTIDHEGIIGIMAKWGRYAMMVGLGASFGNTVAARISLLVGRFQFILMDWLKVIS